MLGMFFETQCIIISVHVMQGLLAAKHRCAMVQLAVESSDWIR